MFQLLYLIFVFEVCNSRSLTTDLFVVGTGIDSNLQENSKVFVDQKILGEDGKLSNQQEITYCGVEDPSPNDSNYTICPNGRCKRYAHYNIRWKSNLITYRIESYPWRTDMSRSDTRKIVENAYKLWSDVTPLKFKEVQSNEDTLIKFAKRNHGDRMKFDGPGNELAHAYHLMGGYGDLNGDIHFDGEEFWSKYRSKDHRRNLLTVLAHEIGHTLGLSHSSNADALMYRYYQQLQQNDKLSKDDIAGIQDLYGRPAFTKQPIRVKKPYCDPGFDATIAIRGELFSFDNHRFWRVSNRGDLVSPQEGHVASHYFRRLPTPIDAAYERPTDGKLIFFKGSYYYEYSDFYLNKFKQAISTRYPRIPHTGIDAVMTIPKTKKTYFFKGVFVWRFDERLKRVDSGYPTITTKLWKGAPAKVTAAFFVNKRVVLLSNDAYYIKKKNNNKPARIGKGKFSENVMRLRC